MSRIWGVSAYNHDAALAVIDNGSLKYAIHSERASRIKNDPSISDELVNETLRQYGEPDTIVYYERDWVTAYRRMKEGQFGLRSFLRSVGASKRSLSAMEDLRDARITHVSHHYAHASAGYYTSGFDNAIVLVADAVGEMDALTIWIGEGDVLKKVYRRKYPNSIGLLYAAFTDSLGLKPNEEEFIMMALAAYGEPVYEDALINDLFKNYGTNKVRISVNPQKGLRDYKLIKKANDADMAASIQKITEDYVLAILQDMRQKYDIENLVFAGGVALNCVLNYKIKKANIFQKIWIMPNPGDAGSSVGAALGYLKSHVSFETPFLGTNIIRNVDPDEVAESLAKGEVVGIANGRAEFGPRALGNRSLLADPRHRYMVDKVNGVKQREPFRPFAPAVLEEFCTQYFALDKQSPYMQYAVPCRRETDIPAVCHIDGTSRVQTVEKNSSTVLRSVLESFYRLTGCPVLLNTSLNVKGQPIVDSWADAEEFSKTTGIKVF